MVDRRLVPDENIGQGSGNKVGDQAKDPIPGTINLNAGLQGEKKGGEEAGKQMQHTRQSRRNSGIGDRCCSGAMRSCRRTWTAQDKSAASQARRQRVATRQRRPDCCWRHWRKQGLRRRMTTRQAEEPSTCDHQ